MSRSKPGYDKECSGAKKMWRRKRRNEGKRLMQDDNPDKGTQGWLTNQEEKMADVGPYACEKCQEGWHSKCLGNSNCRCQTCKVFAEIEQEIFMRTCNCNPCECSKYGQCKCG